MPLFCPSTVPGVLVVAAAGFVGAQSYHCVGDDRCATLKSAALWQSDNFIDENTLSVNVNRLRSKLKDIGIADFIITKKGKGYMV